METHGDDFCGIPHDQDELDCYIEQRKESMQLNDKQKEDYTTFLGGIVVLVAGIACIALERGWIVTITGILITLFGLGLICVGWSNNNEK